MIRRARNARALCVLFMAFAACARGGCAGCKPEPLAVLTETLGSVERDFARAEGRWSAGKAGARFDDGDGLRTGVSAIAVLRLGEAGLARVESETTIRLRRGGAATRQRMDVEVESGTATLLAAKDEGLGVRGKSGSAVLAPGGSLRVQQTQHTQRYEVVLGRASVTTREGKTRELTIGQVFEVEIGLAELEHKQAPPPRAALPAAPIDAGSQKRDAGAPPAQTEHALVATDTDAAEVTAAGLDYAEIALRPGNSATIYDPDPPTAVGFNVGELCPQGASLRVGFGKQSKSARGRSLLSLSLAAGGHDYRIVCANADGAHSKVVSGTVWVVRKAGTDKLPRSAPHNAIDLDGRRYTVIFQNLAPTIEAHWPRAPAAQGYALHATLASGKTLSVRTREPSYSFKPGEIPEGENRLYFESDTPSAQRSRETTVVVKFDNAAPTASLRQPPVEGFAPAAGVAVEGVAMPGSSVSVNGQAVTLDAQQRFSAEVPFAQGTRALAIRIDHPRIGTRYYIRRPAGTR
jgi:hypothetical protein